MMFLQPAPSPISGQCAAKYAVLSILPSLLPPSMIRDGHTHSLSLTSSPTTEYLYRLLAASTENHHHLARQPNGDDEVKIRRLHSCLSHTMSIASFMFSCKQFKSSCILLIHFLHGRPLLRLPSICLLYTSPSPRDRTRSRMPSSA